MTVVQADVKHATQTSKTDNPEYDVSADEWNEGHNVTVGVPSDIGAANAEGSSTELCRRDHVHKHPVFASGDLHTEYVPVDGVARQLADAGYPNALLLDGSRELTSDWSIGANRSITFPTAGWGKSAVKFATTKLLEVAGQVRLVLLDESDYATISLKDINFTQNLLNSGISKSAKIRPSTGDGKGELDFQNWTGSAWISCLRIGTQGSFDPTCYIPRAGDIEFLANKKLKVGNISGTGTPATQTKYFPVDDGGVTRYIPMYNAVS